MKKFDIVNKNGLRLDILDDNEDDCCEEQYIRIIELKEAYALLSKLVEFIKMKETSNDDQQS